ncbi:hypothetical protein PO124_27365 [Bacillus licheniformis]|nr:hypothetical protein [Bacillus licheniformis]
MEAESSLEHTVKRICGTLEDQGLVKDAGQMADGLMKEKHRVASEFPEQPSRCFI